jgi:ubiquinone/menaquinone biosynthesis C-methylase UbiE
MNYKLLFPTYRNRYLFIKNHLSSFVGEGRKFDHALNLGTGEGDYDAMIARFCTSLYACDINREDVEFAKNLNCEVGNVQYGVEDALKLSFPDNSFDLLTSVDVIEHVGRPARMMEEIGRVLKPGGIALITFPSLEFPFTYDPINRILSSFTDRKIPQGAYAFGHEYLVLGADFKGWASKNKLSVLEENNLSGALVALSEMYWTGIVQSIFKANSSNFSGKKSAGFSLRPSLDEPFLTKITDAWIHLDKLLFGKSKHSVGKGFVIQKL